MLLEHEMLTEVARHKLGTTYQELADYFMLSATQVREAMLPLLVDGRAIKGESIGADGVLITITQKGKDTLAAAKVKAKAAIIDKKPRPLKGVSPPNDVVTRPVHYTVGKIECIDAMRSMLSADEYIGFLRGNIFKYQWRYRMKNGLEDLRKAQWYLDRLLEAS